MGEQLDLSFPDMAIKRIEAAGYTSDTALAVYDYIRNLMRSKMLRRYHDKILLPLDIFEETLSRIDFFEPSAVRPDEVPHLFAYLNDLESEIPSQWKRQN